MSTLIAEGRDNNKERRAREDTTAALYEGAAAGVATLLPAWGAVHWAFHNSPGFAKRTNASARTALIVMPAVFAFGLFSEKAVADKMRIAAVETGQVQRRFAYVENNNDNNKNKATAEQQQKPVGDVRLMDLYKDAMDMDRVNVVPGDELKLHHRAANFVADHPLQILGATALPAVAWILRGRAGQKHLELSQKLLHTRVYGQFAALCLALGIMGFKDLMDRNGRYVTEAEVERRAEYARQGKRAFLAQQQLQGGGQQRNKNNAHEARAINNNDHVMHA